MPSTAHSAEADRVELVYYWALSQIANAMVLDALELWKQVPATTAAQNAAWWVRASVKLLSQHRAQARELVLSYYRLTRALRTGATIRDPERDTGQRVSLEALRDQFEATVDDIDPATESPAPGSAGTQGSNSPEAEREALQAAVDDAEEGDDDILLEEIAELDRLIEEQERAAEQEAADLLDQLGIENMLSKLEAIDPEAPAEDVDAQRATVHDMAGRRQAATAARIAMNAARGLSYSLAESDQRIIGWARYSQTGTPCGFCAMLISRALVTKAGDSSSGMGVLFKTRKSAGSSRDGNGDMVADQDRFHDNCRCVAIPIFAPAQLDSELFDLTREYAALWKSEIQGKYSGDEALTEWRRLIRARAKDQQSTTTPPAAQAAA